MAVAFYFPAKIILKKRTELKQFIGSIFKKEKKELGALSYVFCSDDYLLEINRSYLGHDYYTDIITFDLSDKSSKTIEGEIYISVDTIRDNAKRFNTSANQELHRVIFHGALHLCGYNDKTKKDQSVMTQKENEYLNLYF